ncbi:nickel/cobalt transporter [Marinomonas sp. C2222]|uniref:Nickel/cobalt efflux system n=1 Tax=Marinomonas sargassi TaxID=2984494 RepID=A0ABT2YPH8_9GAMM|nr:nickel/cobalt transporter [Marinomonas sargassi]MCV2401796.1 nickel/cobalt transporter [Marinomonas sargassi]
MANKAIVLIISFFLISSPLYAAADFNAYQSFIQWVISQQATFHRELVSLVRAISKEGSAVLLWGLMSSSFFYGIFHAAGPGHGKAVISAYMLASDAPMRRGISLSFLCAGAQALVAILVIVVLSQIFSLAGKVMPITRFFEVASFAAVGLIGVWMLVRLLKGQSSCGHDHSKDHLNGSHAHVHHQPEGHTCCSHHSSCSHSAAAVENSAHAKNGHDHHENNNHNESNTAKKSIWVMVAAVGIRPCTGAVLVLLFSVSTGIFWWGVAATFAMALGTAITVSALAAVSVFIRDASFTLSKKSIIWRQRLSRLFGFIAAFTLIIISCSMIWSYLSNTGRAF